MPRESEIPPARGSEVSDADGTGLAVLEGALARATEEEDSLLAAAKTGDSRETRLILVRRQVNVNGTEPGALAFAAIHHAATNGCGDVMQLLVNYDGIDLNVQDGMGRTALIIASKEGHSHIVRLLLEKGADVLSCGRGDFTCLHMAAFCGHHEIVNLLLHGVSCRGFWDERDLMSLPLLPLDVRKALMEKKSSLEKFTALHMAGSGDHNNGLAITASLLEAYMALVLEIHECTPFTRKVVNTLEHAETYKDFLVEIRDLLSLPEGKHVHQLLLPMKQKYKGVRMYEDWVDAFEDLIWYANAKDCIGRTALHYAAWQNRADLVKFLTWDFQSLILGSVGNVNAPDLDGYTPLHLASWRGNGDVVDALRSHNLRPNPATKPNRQTRKIAEEIETESQGHGEFLSDDQRFLLPRPLLRNFLCGGDYKEERGGLTPLHYAIEGNHPEVVGSLIRLYQIDLFAESSDGKTPWMMAFSEGKLSETWNKDIPWMLRSGGRAYARINGSSRSTPSYSISYFQIVVQKAVALAEKGLELDKLFIALEIQIFLFFAESLEGRQISYLRPSPSRRLYQDFEQEYSRSLNSRSHSFEDDVNDNLKSWEEDSHRKPWKLTLLHVTVYYGFHEELNKLLALKRFKESINARAEMFGKTRNNTFEIFGMTTLDLAVRLCNMTAVIMLLQETTLTAADVGANVTPLEIAVEMQLNHIFANDEKWKGIEGLLIGRADVQRYVDNLYRDRQVYVDAANAILVGAALIASVTFAGWLQPPLGYTTYYQDFFPYPAPPGSTESFAGVEQHAGIRVFWAFNSLSFFSAIATVVAGATTVLPITGQFIKKEVREVRRWLMFTSALLSVSIFCVLGAFTAAGIDGLPPITKYRANIYGTTAVGLVLCLGILSAFLYKLSYPLRQSLKIYASRHTSAHGINSRGPISRSFKIRRD